MISAAPIGPQNSYEVVRGFNSDFFSTAVEEVIGGGEVEVVCDQAVGSLIGVHQRENARLTRVAPSFASIFLKVSPLSLRPLSAVPYSSVLFPRKGTVSFPL